MAWNRTFSGKWMACQFSIKTEFGNNDSLTTFAPVCPELFSPLILQKILQCEKTTFTYTWPNQRGERVLIYISLYQQGNLPLVYLSLSPPQAILVALLLLLYFYWSTVDGNAVVRTFHVRRDARKHQKQRELPPSYKYKFTVGKKGSYIF